MGHAALCSCAGGSAGWEVCQATLVTKGHLSCWPEPSDRRTPAWCHAVCMLCPAASLPTAQHYTEERHRPFHPSFISVLNGLKYLSEAWVGPETARGGEERWTGCASAGVTNESGDGDEWSRDLAPERKQLLTFSHNLHPCRPLIFFFPPISSLSAQSAPGLFLLTETAMKTNICIKKERKWIMNAHYNMVNN